MSTRKTKGSPDPVDKFVGAQIRARRKKLGLSQEKLAEALGVTFQQVQKYESGMNRVACGRIAHISQVLDQPVELFFPALYHGDQAKDQERIKTLTERLIWTIDRLKACGQEIEFTLGLYRSTADRKKIAAGGAE